MVEMMRTADVDGRKAKQQEYTVPEGADFLPLAAAKWAEAKDEQGHDERFRVQYASNASLTINELGKHLLKAALDGNVAEIRALLSKGAPFTADWLGTSPLHLAAQNNHLDVCEILLRAGMSRDARTKVDRTPLHIATYEGHLEIVECLLKNGADCDSKDLLYMTPLHWAAQNGHAEVAALLIRYGATTNPVNKFDLTPADIALQMNRTDIVQIINVGLRDPTVAAQHLALELILENGAESAIEPIVNLTVDDEAQDDGAPDVPLESTMIENGAHNSIQVKNGQPFAEESEDTPQDSVETIEPETNNFSASIKLLQQHGITMLPVDDNTILNSVMESGHSVVLTEAGKQVLNSFKSAEPSNHQDLSEYLKPKVVAPAVKKKKIITVTAEEFLAMTNGGVFGGTQPNVLKQLNGKIVQQRPAQVKRIVMRKNKVVPISPSINVTKVQKTETPHDVDSLLEELRKAHSLIESYKRKLLKSEFEAARYKQQLKLLSEQHRLSLT